MLLSLNWLREFTPFEGTTQELSDRLTMLGLEVEERFNPFTSLEPVVVGHVVECGPHPDADKLSLCKVDIGREEILQIVCGAPNVATGQKVAVAPVGTTLPEGLTIKKAKIRGQVSVGMICSESELGLGDDQSGIMVLDEQSQPGSRLIDVLGLETDVFDVSITPNRADCLSILGLARETAAAYGLPLRLPASKLQEGERDAREEVRIEIPEPGLCPLYQARIIRNVTVARSPDWMRYRLLSVGLRPINNIVDITNYILMELGHPMHAFDLDLLEGDVIRVARASEGMRFTTLDGQERVLTDSDLLIWDGKKPVGLAGVMGGANSEIHAGSRNVLLECAVFDPATIRKTARRLGLMSEASYRFERGVDQQGAVLPVNRGAQFMAEMAGGTVDSHIAVNEPISYQPRRIPFRAGKATSFLSLPLTEKFCRSTLEGLGCEVDEAGESWSVVPPSYRQDLEREVDLFEEVGRIYGLDRIPSQVPRMAKTLESVSEQDTTYFFHKGVKQWARGIGLNEAINYSFVSTRELEMLGEPDQGRVLICNPLSEDQNVMRTVLAPGLLQNLRLNLGYGIRSLRLFEVAHIFFQDEQSETRTKEHTRLALLLSGRRNPQQWPWEAGDVDYLDLKGVVEDLLKSLHLPPSEFRVREDHPYLSPCVECLLGDQFLGTLGRVRRHIAEHYNATSGVWLAELDMDLLREKHSRTAVCFSPLPTYPPVRRDITLIAPRSLRFARIMEAISQVGPAILEDVRLLDIFQPEGSAEHNITLRLTYRHPERTLKDKEVDKMHQKVGQGLLDSLPVRFS